MSCSVSPTTTIRSGFFSTVVVPNSWSTVAGNALSAAFSGAPAVPLGSSSPQPANTRAIRMSSRERRTGIGTPS